MKTGIALIRRNIKLFFADKGMFFTSLITPIILLVLYVTFLGNVYTDSIESALPQGFSLSQSLIDGFAGAQLISSILAVSCITVAFCSNMLMVQDKVNGSLKDLTISPVKPSVLSLSYYVATLVSTLIVCYTATAICLIYVSLIGWYLSALDVLWLLLDVLLLCLFGVALSSIINFFLTGQGQISAVGTIVSAGYGFICGAYMPISQFSEHLQKVLSLLPGTHGTVLVRNHAMRGVLAEMEKSGLPSEYITGIRDAFDCNLYFNGSKVEIGTMYLYLGITIVFMIAVYLLINIVKGKRVKRS